MISIVFWTLAAICKAVADNLAHHFYKSVFNTDKLNRRFWDVEVSNKTPIYLPYTRYKWDGWHVANSLMIIFAGCAIITFQASLTLWWHYPLTLLIYGVIWNGWFNWFYNSFLNKF